MSVTYVKTPLFHEGLEALQNLRLGGWEDGDVVTLDVRDTLTVGAGEFNVVGRARVFGVLDVVEGTSTGNGKRLEGREASDSLLRLSDNVDLDNRGGGFRTNFDGNTERSDPGLESGFGIRSLVARADGDDTAATKLSELLVDEPGEVLVRVRVEPAAETKDGETCVELLRTLKEHLVEFVGVARWLTVAERRGDDDESAGDFLELKVVELDEFSIDLELASHEMLAQLLGVALSSGSLGTVRDDDGVLAGGASQGLVMRDRGNGLHVVDTPVSLPSFFLKNKDL